MANNPTTILPMIRLTREASTLEINCQCGGVIRWDGSTDVRIIRDMTLADYGGVCDGCGWKGRLLTGDARDGDTEWTIDYDPEGISSFYQFLLESA